MSSALKVKVSGNYLNISGGIITGDLEITGNLIGDGSMLTNVAGSLPASIVSTSEALPGTITISSVMGEGTTEIVGGLTVDGDISGNLNASQLTSGTLPIARISDGDITNAKLAANGFDAGKLTTGTLPIARIANGAITPSKTSFLPNVGSSGAIYYGHVGLVGSEIAKPSGWSYSYNVSTNVYTITHNFDSTNYIVVATARFTITGADTVRDVRVGEIGANSFTVAAVSGSGAKVSSEFMFSVIRY